MWTLVVEVLFYALAAALIGMMRIRPVKATAIMMAPGGRHKRRLDPEPRLPTAQFLHAGCALPARRSGVLPALARPHSGGLAGAMGALSVGLCFGLLSTVPGSDFFHAPFTGPVTYLTAAALFLCAMQAGHQLCLAPDPFPRRRELSRVHAACAGRPFRHGDRTGYRPAGRPLVHLRRCNDARSVVGDVALDRAPGAAGCSALVRALASWSWRKCIRAPAAPLAVAARRLRFVVVTTVRSGSCAWSASCRPA